MIETREVRRRPGDEYLQPGPCDRDAGRRADERQWNALCQDLADDARAPGAKCHSQRQFRAPVGTTREQKAGDVAHEMSNTSATAP